MKIGDIGIMVYVDVEKRNHAEIDLFGVHCVCGTGKYPRDEAGKIIRGYFNIIFHIATKGFTCPKCGIYYNGVNASKNQLKSWKKRFPHWPWDELRIYEK